ncbi:hypothetical protein O9929_07470 [Vibrio lentus]|nr:hypothetical protein [Vibrio lentus]
MRSRSRSREKCLSPTNNQSTKNKPTKVHQFAISLCALWFGIILVAYYFIHYNNEQAPFLNKESYQPYQFGSVTLFISVRFAEGIFN